MELITQNNLTMSSKEIAELTGKRHDHVLVDIRKMLAEIDSPEKSGQYKDSTGRTLPMLLLDRAEVDCLITGYSAKLRMVVIKRWHELEKCTVISLPDFTKPAEAARAWADEVEEKARIALELDRAVKTKAEIGSKREATAMSTASKATREVKKLREQLDQSDDYATVKRMQLIHHGVKFNWRLLKSTGIEMGINSIEVFDQNYGTVKAYHVDVWREAYAVGVELAEL